MGLRGQRPLLDLLEEGAADCAARLSKASRFIWCPETAVLGLFRPDIFDAVTDGKREDHYGAYLCADHADFLVIFPRRSGFLITHNFTTASSQKLDKITKREHKTLSEISSILVNSLISPLAADLEASLLLSAPEAMIDNKKGLLERALKRAGDRVGEATAALVTLSTPVHASDTAFLIAFLRPPLAR